MNTEIITIGDELLIGHIADKNAHWLSNYLTEKGFIVRRITTLADNLEEITTNLEQASSRSDFVFITGGLGPTNDDITRKAIAEFFHSEWIVNEKVYKRLESFLRERGYEMSHLNEEQAKVPEGAQVFLNYVGTAPGLLLEKNKTRFIFMPGVHFEMTHLMEEAIGPDLTSQYIKNKLVNEVIITQGIPEAYLAEKLKDWESSMPEYIKIAYLPSPGMVKVRISGKSDDVKNLKEFIGQKTEELRKIVPDYYVGLGRTTLEGIVGNLLAERKETLSTAESCTGGGVASVITSVPGASSYFKGSVVAYSNEIKQNILRISPAILTKFGAVSKQVTENMARNVMKLYKTDYAIAVSGIAGPGGGTDEKPVGTTWITVCDEERIISEKFLFGTKRDVNVQKAINTSLNMLRKLIIEKK